MSSAFGTGQNQNMLRLIPTQATLRTFQNIQSENFESTQLIQTTQLIVITQSMQTLPINNITSIAQLMVITLPSLGRMFDMTTEATRENNQNTGFGMFERNVRISNLG